MHDFEEILGARGALCLQPPGSATENSLELCVQECTPPLVAFWKGTGSQVDAVLNKEARANSRFYRGV